MQRYRSYNDYLKEKFGNKVYKLSLSISGSCPNRDGKCGVGGCIFCSKGGSGDFAAELSKPLKLQVEDAQKRVASKNKSGKYIAYFQSFTSTYIEPQKLKEHLDYVLGLNNIVGISVGTRADCLDSDILKVLKYAAQIKPLTVELGLQTIHPQTAELINRCCPLSEFDKAIKNLKEIGAEVVLHTIFGLPFETEEMMLETIKYVGTSGADGIKIQLLHILKNTRLAEMFEQKEFRVLEKEEYFSLVSKALEILPKDMVIHRLTGDGNKKELIAPLWSADKKRVMNDMNRFFNENNVIQGKNNPRQ